MCFLFHILWTLRINRVSNAVCHAVTCDWILPPEMSDSVSAGVRRADRKEWNAEILAVSLPKSFLNFSFP